MSIINVTGGEIESNFTSYGMDPSFSLTPVSYLEVAFSSVFFILVVVFTGNATERLIESSAVCQPGLQLKIRVRSVNQAENGEFLMSPWSEDGEYQCKPEGIIDVRVHVSFEVVHIHRFEMVPPSLAFPPYFGWPSQMTGQQPPTFQPTHTSPYNQAPTYNPYLPWYLPTPYSTHPVTTLARSPARQRSSANVMAHFGRKRGTRINHPWWWMNTLFLSNYPNTEKKKNCTEIYRFAESSSRWLKKKRSRKTRFPSLISRV